MSAATSRWKNCEKLWAKILCKFGFDAERISRANNYSVSDYDVRVNGHPELISDTKYSLKGFRTSRMLEVVEEKYIKYDWQFPILFCKGYKERGGKVTIDAEFAAMLLAFWCGKGTKEELMAIYNNKKPLDDESE